MTAPILTIEDQPDIRRLIRMTLEFKGYRVVEASDGPEGLRMARTEKPALILLDKMMPGMDGQQVLQALSADPGLAAIPVVMISALATPEHREAGLSGGARAWLVKPFSPFELLDLVRTLTGGSTPAARPPLK